MAGTRTLKVTVLGDARGAQRALGSLDTSVARMASRMTSMGSRLSLGLSLPLLAAGKVAVDEFTEVQQVTGQTEAALKSTGGAANVTADQVAHLSANLGDLAAIDGEVVQQAENVLLTFTKVRNEVGKGNDIFNRASKAALDLSARMGTDLSSAMLQVGKATNDPIKGVTALSRAGIQFSEDQKFMIASLVESGDLLGAQKIVLAELEKQVGGSAKAAGKAASPLTKMGLALRDMAEQAGSVLVPMLNKLADWMKNVADGFKDLSPGMQKFIVLTGAAAAALGPLMFIGGKLVTLFGAIKAAVALANLPLAMGQFFGGIQIAGMGATASVTGLAASLSAALPILAAITAAFVVLAPETFSAGSHLHGVADALDGVNEEFKTLMSIPGEAIAGAFKQSGDAALAFAEQTVTTKEKLQGFASMSKEAIRGWKDDVTSNLDLVEGTLSSLADKANLTVDKILNAFRKKLTAVEEFGRNIKTLAEKGLSEFAAMTLAKMGEAGAHIAATLVDGTRRDIAQFNRFMAQGAGGANRFTSVVRGAMANAGGAVDGLNSKIQNLVNSIALAVAALARIATMSIPSPGGGSATGGSGGSSSGPSQGGYYKPGMTTPRQNTTIVQLDKKTLWESSTSYGDVNRIVLGGR